MTRAQIENMRSRAALVRAVNNFDYVRTPENGAKLIKAARRFIVADVEASLRKPDRGGVT